MVANLHRALINITTSTSNIVHLYSLILFDTKLPQKENMVEYFDTPPSKSKMEKNKNKRTKKSHPS